MSWGDAKMLSSSERLSRRLPRCLEEKRGKRGKRGGKGEIGGFGRGERGVALCFILYDDE